MKEQRPFRSRIYLRWADIDANFHLRHSVFYDLCAQQRMDALTALGVGMPQMKKHHFGPILFREECTFRREIKLGCTSNCACATSARTTAASPSSTSS